LSSTVAPPAGSAPAGAPGSLRRPSGRYGAGTLLGLGIATLYLSLIVLIPLAAVASKSFEGGLGAFWDDVTSPQAVAALELTFGLSLAAVVVNGIMGTVLAWVLVRDRFPGRRMIDALIDLPFALPTIVAGLTLLALYGPRGPVGIDIAFSRIGITMALVFVTLPFVVRAVQPVLMELDREMEEAAASLGASRLTIFRRIILPNLGPAILSGVGLSFSKALGEFGSVVLIAGNIPFQTEVASVFIFGQIENDDVPAAAAVSVVLLVASLAVLLSLTFLERRFTRHAG
jgi:sulfate/thiosulfate transport system permease protein